MQQPRLRQEQSQRQKLKASGLKTRATLRYNRDTTLMIANAIELYRVGARL